MTQPVKYGVLSLSASSETGDDTDYLKWHQLADDVAALLAADGIAGFWHFNPGSLRTDRFDPSGFSASVIYLDDDPVATAAKIEPVLTTRWAHDGISPALAAPFAALRPWEWDAHGQPDAPITSGR